MGSSAMSTSGSLAIAMAIIARWRMPPENSWGNCPARVGGLGDAHPLQHLDGPFLAPSRPSDGRWAAMPSAIWAPTRCTRV